LKEKDEVPGWLKGEHESMHRGQLVKEKAIVTKLFIMETITDFEIISGGRISFGKSARDCNIYLLAAKQNSPTGTANDVLTLSFKHLVAVHCKANPF
jgi:hypothetical protein